MAKLTKYFPNNKIGYQYGSSVYFITARPMSCGSAYHNCDNHKFEGTSSEVKLLTFILKKLNVKVYKETSISFHFNSKNRFFQKIMFKLCRYVRCKETLNILETIKSCIKKGVKPYNAIVLGHYSNLESSLYINDMDIIPHTRCVRKGFKTEKDFLNRKSVTVNYFYKSFRNKFRKDLYKLLQNKKYIEAEKLILDYE